MKYYTGVGSRNTPQNILEIMTKLARYMERQGYILRSGGATGADSAFATGATRKNVFRPEDATAESMEIAKQFHPAWHRCNEYARKLHARNAFQVLGRNLKTPSKLLVCWTPDGCTSHASRVYETGGTGTAISIADAYGVKIFNLATEEHLIRITKKLDSISPH